MTSRRTLLRVQQILFAGCLLLGAAYLLADRGLARQSASLDRPLTNAVHEVQVALNRNPLLQGLDAAGRERRLRTVEQAVANLQAANRQAQERSALDPALRDRLQEPFQLIDFENSRADMIGQLRRFAGTKKVTVAPAVLNAYPEYVGGLSRPSLLWAQLALVNQVLVTATAQQPRTISAIESLPPRSHALEPGQAPLDELSVRVEFFGSMEALQRFLVSLPLRDDELKAMGCPDLPVPAHALSIDRFLLRNATSRPGEIQAEIVVSSFIHPSEWSLPTRTN